MNAEESDVRLKQLSSFIGSTEQVLCDLLVKVEIIINPTELPKVERALLDLAASNYSEKLGNLGVEPPEPGWDLDQLLTSGGYLHKKQYYRK